MTLNYKTVWISDTHLGSRGSRARELGAFLKNLRCEKLYLVGDIIDLWRLKSKWYWPPEHNDVVRRILKKASVGVEVFYIPGNHDDGARQFINHDFGGIKIVPYLTHYTVDGRKLFVTHGDQFDMIVTHSKLLAGLGGTAYEVLIDLNRRYNTLRKFFGLPYVSLSKAIKNKVKAACMYTSRYEELLANFANQMGFNGVVCGHIHRAEVNRDAPGGIEYYNCGDWVENCTALGERADGRIELIDAAGMELPESEGNHDLPPIPTTAELFQITAIVA